jgi:hypothetical protein
LKFFIYNRDYKRGKQNILIRNRIFTLKMGKVLRMMFRTFRSTFYALFGSKQDQATNGVRATLEAAVQVDVRAATTTATQTIAAVREQMKQMIKQMETLLTEITQILEDYPTATPIHADKVLQTAYETGRLLHVVSDAEWEIQALLHALEEAKAKTQTALATATVASNTAAKEKETPGVLASWSFLQTTLLTAIDTWNQASCKVQLMIQVMHGIHAALSKATQIAGATNEVMEQKQQALEKFHDAAYRFNRANDDCIRASLSEIVAEAAVDRCQAQQALETAIETEENTLAEIREVVHLATQADFLFHHHIATIAAVIMQISLSAEDISEMVTQSAHMTKTATAILQHAFDQMITLAE